MTRNEAKLKAVDEKLDGCPYPELASEGYSLAVDKLREMVKPYLQDDDLGL